MNIFRRIDHYLLINYPLIWLSKIVYILPICLLSCIAVWGYQQLVMGGGLPPIKIALYVSILFNLFAIVLSLIILAKNMRNVINKIRFLFINIVAFLGFALLFISVLFVSVQKLQQKTKNLITISPNDSIPIESKILDLLQKQADTLTVALFDTTISKNIKNDGRNLYQISNTHYNKLLIRQIIGTDKSIYRQQPLIRQVKQANFDSLRQAYQIPAKRICENYGMPYEQQSVDDNMDFFMDFHKTAYLQPFLIIFSLPWLIWILYKIKE